MDKMKAKRIAVFIGLKIVEVVGFILAVAAIIAIICAIFIGFVLAFVHVMYYCFHHPWTWWIAIPLFISLFLFWLEPKYFGGLLKDWCKKNWAWAGKIVGVPEDKKNTPTTE